MKVALVTPHPSPLALGGAENLWWGLQDHIQNHTEHDCDIVSVMAPESTFWDLISSYETFSKLDLSTYDCVISGKYPGWMVNHPHHICYMLHRLRGLYDTYNASQHDETVLTSPKIRNLADWLREGISNPDPDHIPLLFDRLRALRDGEDHDADFAFPGPLSRLVIHFLDNAALSPQRITRYAAISKTVALRKDYFPPNAPVDVLYPPPHRDNYTCGKSDYFFTSSRLDKPKRIDLLIDAMKHVKQDIPFLIAGSGPDEARLKKLAEEDPRISFLGYVDDEKMPALYADARAVPFVPADEDYGLITIEAMKSGKPVITTTDSGGPCEFVDHGKTGFTSAPDAIKIAAHMEAIASDAALAKNLGQAARDKVNSITWDNVTNGLLEQTANTHIIKKEQRPKLTVATTFRIFPPMNGGQSRVFHLYRNLAKAYDIDIISLGSTTDSRSEIEIAPGMLEITVPRSEAHGEAEIAISKQVKNKPVGDITANILFGLTPDYADALELSALTSEAVIACHPFTIDVISQVCADKPLWYEAQDVELILKTSFLGDDPAAKPLLDEVKRAEKKCWINAARVFACAKRDLAELERLYGPTRAFLHEVPNGVSLEDVRYTPLEERRRLQKAAKIQDQQVAIFMGSWHGPNLEAVDDIITAAPKSPKTRFVIFGSVCAPFKDHDLPQNVELMGRVDMETRDLMMSVADVALNPMRSGTGTNLKMLDYMAAGIPVISTRFGARGLSLKPTTHYVAGETHELAQSLLALAAMDDTKRDIMIKNARTLVEQHYAWDVIAARFVDELR